MDQAKMAEGRRVAAERRKAEEEARRAKAKRQKEEREERERQEQERLEKLRLAPSTIADFERLRVQMKTFHTEFNVLSKKSPDGPVNKFKLRFLNDTFKKVNAILGDQFRPFPEFEVFNEDDLPTASDTVMMLAHYLDSMTNFRKHHTYYRDHETMWYTKGGKDVFAATFKRD